MSSSLITPTSPLLEYQLIIDLPLAAPSIRAGMNQTILLSLVTVVVASLIGAKGLVEDVLGFVGVE